MANILSISYDTHLLLTRDLLLQQLGHAVIAAESIAQAYEQCAKDGKLDLIVLAHSIPQKDKKAIIERCQRKWKCPVLDLIRPNESAVAGATLSIRADDPKQFMNAVRQLITTD